MNLVLANNAISFFEICNHILNDATIFAYINVVSPLTVHCVLQRNQLRMKQLHKVLFERNCDRVKNIRHYFVEVCIQHFLQNISLAPTKSSYWFVHLLVYMLFCRSLLPSFTILPSFTQSLLQRVFEMDV